MIRKYVIIPLLCLLFCCPVAFAERYDPPILENTQLLKKLEVAAMAYNRAQMLINEINNTSMFKALLGDERPIMPEELFKQYEVFDKLKDKVENLLSGLESLSELYPEQDQIEEVVNALNSREQLEEWYKSWTDKADKLMVDNFGMSISTFEQVKNSRGEVLAYFKDLQDKASGTNTFLELKLEQQQYTMQLLRDMTANMAKTSQAMAALHEQELKRRDVAHKQHKRETDMSGWSEISKGGEHEKLGPSWR